MICRFGEFSFYTGRSKDLDEGLGMCFYKVRAAQGPEGFRCTIVRACSMARGLSSLALPQEDQITPHFYFFMDSMSKAKPTLPS